MRDSMLGPGKALLMGFPLALFLGALLGDVAYYRTYNLQWLNFAAWLNAGALLFGGFVLLVGLIDFFRRRGGRSGLFLLLVAAMFVIGFVNALIHARDGWATMPTGLILSVIVALLAIAAAVVGVSGTRTVEAK